jgi:hypothetical protein
MPYTGWDVKEVTNKKIICVSGANRSNMPDILPQRPRIQCDA